MNIQQAAKFIRVVKKAQYPHLTNRYYEVIGYANPEIFEFFKEEGLKRGHKYVESGALARSSYHTERHGHV